MPAATTVAYSRTAVTTLDLLECNAAGWIAVIAALITTALSKLPIWVAATVYAQGAFHVPTVANDCFYEVTTGGTSHATVQPTWPTVAGQTVTDGTVVWTCRKLTYTEPQPGALTLKRYGDGSFEFTGVNGQVVRAQSNDAIIRLFAALDALV